MTPTDRAASARRLRNRSAGLAAALLFFLALSGRVLAQPVLEFEESLDFDRTESWAMAYFASASLLTGMGVPRPREPGSVELALEGLWVPALSEEERTVGFDGTKTEDLNKTSFFLRPRVTIGLPRKLSLEVSYVPPVEVFNVEPHLLALGLGRPVHETERWRLGLRLYAEYGTYQGDFTCSQADVAGGDDPRLNPFGCVEPSRDETTALTATVEASAAWSPGQGSKFEPYLAVGVSRMDLEFRVDARYRGIIDRTTLRTDGRTFYATLGTEYRASPRWRWGFELFYSPLDVVRPPSASTQNDPLFNARASLCYSFG